MPATTGSSWIVMGVSGSGKSTVGAALALALGLPFLEGDAFHPAHNVAKMSAGMPLDDADRAGWLRTLAQAVERARACAAPVVLSCSALKRGYRDRLRRADPGLRFVHLHGPRALLEARLRDRVGHYMPASLLDSQLDLLEPLAADEPGLVLDAALAPGILVERIVAAGPMRWTVPGAR